MLTTGGFLIARLDITDLKKLELVPTLFGFLTIGFLVELDKVLI